MGVLTPRMELRIALDTHVLLAAFVARGLCADLLALLLRLQLDEKALSHECLAAM